VATDKPGESSRGSSLEPGPQWSEPGYLVNVDWLGQTFDPRGSKRLNLKEALDQAARLFGYRDGPGRGDRLHPCSTIGRMSNRRILCVPVAGSQRSHHHLAGIDTDARLQRNAALSDQLGRVPPRRLLQTK